MHASLLLLVFVWSSSLGYQVGSYTYDKMERPTCLPSVGFRKPKNLTYEINGHKVNTPLRLFAYSWDSGVYGGELYAILMRERLGYEVVLSTSFVVGDGIRAVAGCTDFTDGTCADQKPDDPVSHILLEFWASYDSSRQALSKSMQPINMKSFLFRADEGVYVPGEIFRTMYYDKFITLDWYRSLNATQLGDAYKLFSSMPEILSDPALARSGALSACVEVENFRIGAFEYANFQGNGDPDAYVADGNGNYLPNCDNEFGGKVWLSKKCRELGKDSNGRWRCLPVVTCEGWLVNYWMQWSLHWDWAVMILSTDWDAYVHVGTHYSPLLYWFWPDKSFPYTKFLLIGTPGANELEHLAGIHTSGIDKIELSKWAWNQIKQVGFPESIQVFTEKFDFDRTQMAEIMAHTGDHYSSACDWLKANAAIWEKWILPTCSSGEWLNEKDMKCELCAPGKSSNAGDRECYWSCKAGTYAADDGCLPCTAGTESLDNMKSCQPCSPGFVNNESGSLCQPCNVGTFSSTSGMLKCEVCEAGTFTAGLGLSECQYCSAGENAAEAGMSGCQRCEIGSFASSTKSVNCTLCPQGQTTRYPGSTDLSDCVCSVGYYASGNGCVACPVGSTTMSPAASNISSCLCAINQYMQLGQCVDCPSGSLTRMTDGTLGTGQIDISACKCETGFYMTGEDQCDPCPEGFICAEGSECKSDRCALDQDIQNPVLQVNFWSAKSKPLSAFKCGSDKRCPDGRQPGQCAGGLQDRACAQCEEEWVYDGENCIKCTSVEASSFLFPILPCMLGPIIVVFLYKIGGDEYEKWNSYRTGCMNVAFILFNHYQIIALMRGVNLVFPANVAASFDFFSFTSDVSTIFKPSCAGFGTFQTSLIMKSLSPVIIACVFVVTWLMSLAVATIFQRTFLMMTRDRTINAFFSLMLTFFAGIAAMAFTLFKCGDNPNGKRTLLADRSVICGEADWEGMLVVGLLAVLLWCVGLGGVFLWAVIQTPVRFHDRGFQMRWKFLFIKFRPDVHWWAITFVVKGVILNFGFLFLDTGIGQSYWLMFVLSVYLMLAAFFRPWRHITLSYIDMYAHIALILTCSVLVWFIRKDLNEEMIKSFDTDMSNLAIAMSFLCFPFCMPFLVYMILWRALSSYQEQRKSQAMDLRLGMKHFSQMDDADYLRCAMELPEADFRFLLQAKHVLFTEFLATKSRPGLSPRKLNLPPLPKLVDQSEKIRDLPLEEEADDASFLHVKEPDSDTKVLGKDALERSKMNLQIVEAVNEILQLSTTSVSQSVPLTGRGAVQQESVAACGATTPRMTPRGITPRMTPRGITPRMTPRAMQSK